jgi:hypothetical protein
LLHTNKKQAEEEITKTIPFTISSKKQTKKASNKLNQEGKRPLQGIYKTLKKETEEDTRR